MLIWIWEDKQEKVEGRRKEEKKDERSQEEEVFWEFRDLNPL